MGRGTKILLIILAGLIVIAGIFLYVLWPDKTEPPAGQTVDETAPVEKLDLPAEEITIELPELTAEEKAASSARSVAQAFIERFGTYSNESNYSGIVDLRPMMTNSFAQWVEQVYLPQLIQEHAPDGFFYRLVTQAPVLQVEDQTDTTISFKVTTQREETVDQQGPETFLQDALIDLVKVNNNWLVDGVYWQAKR